MVVYFLQLHCGALRDCLRRRHTAFELLSECEERLDRLTFPRQLIALASQRGIEWLHHLRIKVADRDELGDVPFFFFFTGSFIQARIVAVSPLIAAAHSLMSSADGLSSWNSTVSACRGQVS